MGARRGTVARVRDVTSTTRASDDVEGASPTETPAPNPEDSRETAATDGKPSTTDWHKPMLVEATGPRKGLWLGLLGGIAVLGAAGALMATNLPGGTTLVGAPVGTVDDAPAALAQGAAGLTAQTFRLITDAGNEVVVTGTDLGLAVDVDASIQPVAQGLPSIAAWLTRLPSGPLAAPVEVVPLDPDVLASVADEVSLDPVNAAIDVRRAGIDVVEGVDGIDVTPDAVATALDAAIDEVAASDPATWPDVIDVPVAGTPVPPPVGQADIDALSETVANLESAEVVVTGEVILPDGTGEEDTDDEDGASEPERVDQAITLTGGELRTLVDVEADPDAPAGERLVLVPGSTPARLVALMDLAKVPPELTAHIENRSPTPSQNEDATDVSDITGDIVVDDVVPGFEPDREATLAQVIDAALAGGGEVRIVGDEQATVTPEDVGIREPISTFTTYYTPGQSRVTNIRRFAELVDGVIVPSGESFEINHHVGRRTAAKGFVGGGAIQNGEVVTEFGGGVSQFSTTFFNAAWFAGVELVDFKAHSVYFSRYPPGREATLNWPNVNNEIRNNTPYDILIDTHSTDNSVTVTFWSTPYWDVQTVMGPCQCGGSFRVTNQRILTAPGGTPVTEEYTTIYTVLRN